MPTVPNVPAAEPREALEDLAALLSERPCVVLSGAGCSTESGIPDYRGPDGRRRTRGPMRFQEFMAGPGARARYWARSMVGWPTFSASRPNAGHRALAALEHAGYVRGVITQNVDELHQRAGSRDVLDLHGALSRVRCTGCGDVVSRDLVQELLAEMNPGFARAPEHFVADGDAELPDGVERGFRVPDCGRCGGILKPDVVFFGESVPRDRLERAWALFARGASLVVVGSSLTVFSGRRFVLRAAQEDKPIAVVNVGPTRGDEHARWKVEERLGTFLPRLAEALGATPSRAPAEPGTESAP